MYKAAVFVLLVALLASNGVDATYQKCVPITECKANTSLRISLKGPGHCSASGASFCGAWIKGSRSCFDSSSFYADLRKCRTVDVRVDAKCHAQASALAIAATRTQAECAGKDNDYTFACVSAQSDADAIACAVAKVFVDLYVSVGGHDNAVCDAAVDASITAIAQATASAFSKSCVGSNQASFDRDFALAKALEEVFAKVFAACFVYCEDKKGESIAISAVDGDAKAGSKKSKEKETTKGDGAQADANATNH